MYNNDCFHFEDVEKSEFSFDMVTGKARNCTRKDIVTVKPTTAKPTTTTPIPPLPTTTTPCDFEIKSVAAILNPHTYMVFGIFLLHKCM